MAPPQLRQQTSNCSLLIYRPQKDERLSWLGWLTYSGWFTDISGHPSARPTCQAQDKESSPAKDRRSTVVPRVVPSSGLLILLAVVTLGGAHDRAYRIGLRGSRDLLQWAVGLQQQRRRRLFVV